jgi:hypothetical protein
MQYPLQFQAIGVETDIILDEFFIGHHRFLSFLTALG